MRPENTAIGLCAGKAAAEDVIAVILVVLDDGLKASRAHLEAVPCQRFRTELFMSSWSKNKGSKFVPIKAF